MKATLSLKSRIRTKTSHPGWNGPTCISAFERNGTMRRFKRLFVCCALLAAMAISAAPAFAEGGRTCDGDGCFSGGSGSGGFPSETAAGGGFGIYVNFNDTANDYQFTFAGGTHGSFTPAGENGTDFYSGRMCIDYGGVDTCYTGVGLQPYLVL